MKREKLQGKYLESVAKRPLIQELEAQGMEGNRSLKEKVLKAFI